MACGSHIIKTASSTKNTFFFFFFWWREKCKNKLLSVCLCCFSGERLQRGSCSMCLVDDHSKSVLHCYAPRRNSFVQLFIATVFSFLDTNVFLASFNFLCRVVSFCLLPTILHSSGEEQKPNWMRLGVSQSMAFHNSCRAQHLGNVLTPSSAFHLGLYSSVNGQNTLPHLLYLKPVLIQVTAPHTTAYFKQEQGNALFNLKTQRSSQGFLNLSIRCQ